MTKEKWNKLSDKKRWQWVIANQDKGITVLLDNDQTFISFPDEDADCLDFDDYIGNSGGVVTLLEILGVRAEGV